MNPSLSFVSAILVGGQSALLKAVQKGVRPSILSPDAGKALDYVFDHWNKYKEIPSFDVVFGKTGVDLPTDPGGSPDFLCDLVLDLHLNSRVEKLLTEAFSILEQSKSGQKAIEYATAALRELYSDGLGGTKTQSLLQFGEQYLKFYEARQSGIVGIPFPWKTLTDATTGMWPQQMFLYVARVKTGKSWIIVNSALVAWRAGYRVLLVTVEMSPEEISQRFFNMALKQSPSLYMKGKLPVFQENKMRETVQKMMAEDDNNFRVTGGGFNFSVEQVSSAIDECQPDLLVVDGAYLLQPAGKTEAKRTERVAQVFNDLKLLLVQKNIPGVISTQFNREVKKNSKETVAAEHIGMTDVAGMNCTGMLGLFQTTEQKIDNRMSIVNMGFRNAHWDDFETNWNIDTMDFSEFSDGEPHEEVASDGGGLF